ncbi:uncharacterized protein LOC114306260 isoform X1 [Camellia sinensis]|uniref:uncharacterized protein LOC114306260 isoform X1 n=2 Tax=Camellia sinensis TaxID=4442 RepID=UPI001036DD33|nr:uncharacterized protein LOC114306260 isoform X1 [Camellia sinensis]XP_028107270.1 uncharacterized protein LOC114306260 isoform X1 [Camellia sinensis]
MALDALYLLKLLLRSGPPVATIPQISLTGTKSRYAIVMVHLLLGTLKNGTELFFRGQLIWETLMDELLSIGLSNARQLEGSPIVVAQNEKIDASMVNRVSCNRKQSDSSVDVLTSDIAIEVSIEIPFAFQPIPVQAIESTDTQVLEQILRIMLPCFMAQSQHDELEAKFFEERAPLKLNSKAHSILLLFFFY